MNTETNFIETKTQWVNLFNEKKFLTIGSHILTPDVIRELKEHPLNYKGLKIKGKFILPLYNEERDFADGNSRWINLLKQMKEHYQLGHKYGNTEIVIISKNGFILSGHRRCRAAIRLGIPILIQVVDELYDSSLSYEEQQKQLIKWNAGKNAMRDESTFESIIQKQQAHESGLVADNFSLGIREIEKERKTFILQQTSVDIKDYSKMLKVWHSYPQLVRDVDAGITTVDKAYQEFKNSKSKVIADPKQHNWAKTWEDKKLIKKFNKEFCRYIKPIINYKSGSKVSLVDSEKGISIGALSTFCSHGVMFCGVEAINAETDIQVYTEVYKGGNSPDIYAPELTDEAKRRNVNHPPAVLEVKSAAWDSNTAKWHGGPDFKKEPYDYYIFHIYEQKGQRYCAFVIRPEKSDVTETGKSGKGGASGKHICNFQTLMKNHYHKNDFTVIAGEIFETTKGKFSINWASVK